MSNKDQLFQIADSQQGYFTSHQAIECGYSQANFHRYVSSGQWMKEQRGIYRLTHYPITSHSELVLWALWSQNKKGIIQGVWSHETALEIYEISDVMPDKMHLTVPMNFRKSTEIPKQLILHFEDLSDSDVVAQQGYLITTPLKTLITLVNEDKLSKDLIIQALQEALQKGLSSRKDLNQAAALHGNSKLQRILDDYNL